MIVIYIYFTQITFSCKQDGLPTFICWIAGYLSLLFAFPLAVAAALCWNLTT